MAGIGEHMHFVYDNPGHFLWGVGSKADTGYQAQRRGPTPKAEKEPGFRQGLFVICIPAKDMDL